MKEEIKKIINDALKKLNIGEVDFIVEHPEDLNNGDYSVNVAMVLAKKQSISPRELAGKIFSSVKLPESIKKMEVAGVGFINIYLSDKFFQKSVKEICNERENFGRNKNLSGKKVIVEYTDPNPFKEFHIGHLMSNIIGEAISRVIEASGAQIRRACYQGDVGMHTAKALWGYQKQKDWKTAYAFGAKAYEENEEAQKEILEINKKIYNRTDSEINTIYDEGKQTSLEQFEKVYQKLGTKFDFYFFESNTGTLGKEIVEKNTGKVFEMGENKALVFHGEKFNKSLHTRVFVNSENIPTYEAKELGLAKIKYEKYPYDMSFVVTGNEINQYFQVLIEAMRQIFPELAEKTIHVSHGMLRLPSGKMSSRTGDVITAESLFSVISEKVIEKVRETNRGNMSEEFINQVAVSALKYSILKQKIGADIIYDFDKSISFEGNSGPYLQYSYARARSIVKKAEEEGIQSMWQVDHIKVSDLERMFYRFPEIVKRAGEEYEPHYITTYLTELARTFNAYYGNNKIIDKEDPASSYKVALTDAFSVVMKNGLWLLGIEAPEKM